MILRRSRFRELAARQLDIFEAETSLLAEAAEADAAWSRAGADETEDLYGDYQLVVDAIGEALYDLREGYAASLDDTTADEYRTEFDKVARKRFGRYVSILDGE